MLLSLGRRRSITWLALSFRSSKGFNVTLMISGVQRTAASRITSMAVATAGSVLMMDGESGGDLLHCLERNILGGPDAAPEMASIAQREKSLGNDDEEIDVYGNGDQQNSKC